MRLNPSFGLLLVGVPALAFGLAAAPPVAVVAAHADAAAESPRRLDAEVAASVDALFTEWDRTTSPGCALGIVADGHLIHARGYGMADLERSVTLGPRSVFDIASTSKQFVAMCLLLLEEEGRLSLDDDVRKHVPELSDYGNRITLRHLVHHTSGIRDYLVLLSMAGLPVEHDYPEAQIVDLLSRQRSLNFTPGDEHLYSNSGYFLLGEIVHRVTGRTLGEYARERIFDPLGMRSTQFYDDFKRVVPDRAIGYLPTEDGGFATELYLFDVVGDGGLLTTVEDLARWDANFYDNRLGRGEPALIDRMLTPGRLNDGTALEYACGLNVSSYRGLPMVSHAGGWAGYRAQMVRFPEHRVSIIVLANLGSINPTGLARSVADIVLAEHFQEEQEDATTASAAPPAADEASVGAVEVPAEVLARWTGAYRRQEVGALWNVSLEGGRLQVEAGGQTYPLEPYAADRFRLGGAPVPVTLHFQPGEAGVALAVDIEGAPSRRYDRIDLATPTADELREYAGRYESDELLAVYELRVDADALRVAIGFRPLVELEATVEDEFTFGGMRLRFARDEGGAITGFTIGSGRVRDISFSRAP